MNDKEIKIFYEVLDVLNMKKLEHPREYNNVNTKFIFKEERHVTNNVVKGIIMFELNNEYIVDIYIDNGMDNILNGLLNLKFNNFEHAKEEYDNLLKYLDYTDILTILTDAKQKLLLNN